MKFEKIGGAQNHHLFRPCRADGTVRDVIWVRFYRVEKGRLEESLKTTHLGEARDKRDRRISEFLGERPKSKNKFYLVEDKFPEFLELKKLKSQATYDSMLNQWTHHLKPGLGHLILDEVNNNEWLKYVSKKRADPIEANRKFFNDRKYLSMFLIWCHEDGLIQKLPKLEDVDPEIEAGKVYSNDEIRSLLKVAAPDLAFQMRMAITMGMRHGEIWTLEWSQINWQKKTIHLPAAKTKIRKARTFAISTLCSKLLSARHKESSSPWVFPHPKDETKPEGRYGIKNHWEKARELTSIEGTFHDFRHTFLTHAFKTSTNPALICEYAGLSLDEAYKTYLHFTPEDTRVVADLVKVPA